MIGVIGGSGVYNVEGVEIIKEHSVDTPFGKPSGNVLELSISGHHFYFIPRHGKGHSINPSEINYRANIFALKKLGAKSLISISAVGSLKEEHGLGHFVLPSQFIDWTKGLRKRTFFENGMVGHVSVAEPVNPALQERAFEIIKAEGIKVEKGGTYVCVEGPQFSSRAESNIYRSHDVDVIGMTNVPESYLAKEAGMAFTCISMITDYDNWKEEHCTLEEIMKVMNENNIGAQKVIKKLIPSLYESPIDYDPENKYAVVTNPELLTNKHKEIMNVLIDG